MSLPVITPQNAKQLIEKGALLVDVRGPGEFSGGHIVGAINTPLPTLTAGSVGDHKQTIVYYCKSGMRTKMNASALATAAKGNAFILAGGVDAWRAAGFDITSPEPSGDASAGLLNRLAKLFS
ncbi:MAG: hypothetical protein KGO94_07915 [Alphaproteobacteria bacterium]|nr:hypothetical protein [Alphaproteobacteria bacterium]